MEDFEHWSRVQVLPAPPKSHQVRHRRVRELDMTPHTIALVAHDHKKDLLIEWAKNNKERLSEHSLVATGTTGRMLNELVGLNVRCLKSGPLGGDQQLGAMICEQQVDMLIFFWDPLEPQPHDPDVRALLRIAVVYDIPTASNLSTADCLMSSPLFAD